MRVIYGYISFCVKRLYSFMSMFYGKILSIINNFKNSKMFQNVFFISLINYLQMLLFKKERFLFQIGTYTNNIYKNYGQLKKIPRKLHEYF